jgi:hypothetical protein
MRETRKKSDPTAEDERRGPRTSLAGSGSDDGHDALAAHLATIERLGLPYEEPESDTVAFPGGFVARRQFARKALRGLPDHTPAGITMVMTVHDDGKTGVHSVIITDEGFEELGDAELAEIGAKLIEARDEILRIELQEITPDRGYTPGEAGSAKPEDFETILAIDAGAARKSVKTARRRRQVTPELLARVLDLYDGDVGGIRAVMAGTNYSESYCFKLLRQARQAKARTDRKKVKV